MSQSISINSLSRSSSQSLKKIARFHYVISISLLVIGVAFTTYYINDILNNTSVSNDSAAEVGFSDKFDTETINKINKFKYSNETTTPSIPSGRTNPFTE